ncbi:hypothetical protein [Antarcticirhabdus aurantiaca]|uniref:Uncharacterized protein n=1 Tax=Antarcticirhabdus aurantiaca TaxID=2606717 RepID=A0ACD4NJL5_9HYPH|nr:hypothetical protein [Antarcticirhabdus aurantiaca]WAJ27055.1 hypothetical protein OXU80_19635 [Jeongeuplla avenae]
MNLNGQPPSSSGSRGNITRRGLLMGLGGIAAAAVLGGGAASMTDEDFLRSTLHRLVGRFEMTSDQFAAFTQSFRAGYPELATVKMLPFRVSEQFGASSLLDSIAPQAILSKVETFERRLLTEFIMSTDYLPLYEEKPNQGVLSVSYFGLQGCSNPYADLTMA